ncbi:MAG TPA: hypothetical protein VNI20_03295 [Fimbriimonadaceae bacterium]|nr:hypothetical protein [Fimbriimonadaceae bacterium]
MKLNLLPSHVSRSQGALGYIVFAAIVIIVAIFLSVGMVKRTRAELEAARADAKALEPQVAAALGKSKMADTVVQQVTGIQRNLLLTDAMLKHDTVYTTLYRDVEKYIPSFYRINSIAAAPANAQTCTVTMVGVLETPTQYADLVAALYRMPNVTSVTRQGFANTRPYVPSLNQSDQTGTPIQPGEGNLPSDPAARMAELIRRASAVPNGFLGTGGFGQDVSPKGAMPYWSTVTVTMTINRNIQTPNPRATLDQQAGGGAGRAGGRTAGFGAPGGPGRGSGPSVAGAGGG